MYLSYFIILSLFLKYVKLEEHFITHGGTGHVTQRETLVENSYFEYNVEDEEHDIHGLDIKIVTKLEFRIAIKDRRRFWIDGIVPYVLSKKYATNERNAILAGMEAFKSETCIRFVPRTKELVYLKIDPKSGCSASVGKFIKNFARLSRGCFQKGIVMHELMHVLGFMHEQNRPDRDEFVTINYDNILPRHKKNFDKAPARQIQNGNISYDYDSVMHYGTFTFAKNRSIPTVIPLQEGARIGQRDGFSDKDIQKINLFYHCKPQAEKQERSKRVKRYANHNDPLPVRRVEYGHIASRDDYSRYAQVQHPRETYGPVAYPNPVYPPAPQQSRPSYPQRPPAYPEYYGWPPYQAPEQPKLLYPPPSDEHKIVYPSQEQPKLPYPPSDGLKIVYPTQERPISYSPAQQPKLPYPEPSHPYSPSNSRRPSYAPVDYRRDEYRRPTYAPVQHPRPAYGNEGSYRLPYAPFDYPKPVYTTAAYRQPPYYPPPYHKAEYPPMDGYGYLPDPKPYNDPYYETTTEQPFTETTEMPLTTTPVPTTIAETTTALTTTTAALTTTTAVPSTTTVVPTTTTAMPTTTTAVPTTTTAVPTTTTVAPTTTTAMPTTTTAVPTTTTAVPTTTTAVATTTVAPTSTMAIPTTTTAVPTTTTAVPTSTTATTTTAAPTTTTSVPTTTTAALTTTTMIPTTTTMVPTTTTMVPTTTTMVPTTTTMVPTTTTEVPTTTTEVPTTASGGTEEDSTTGQPTTTLSTTDEITDEVPIDEGYMPYYYPYDDYYPAYEYSFLTYRGKGDDFEDKGIYSDSYHKMRIFPAVEGRTALRDPTALWTRGIIPYELSDKYDDQQKGFVLEAMQEFHNKTCVRFVPRRNQASYILVEPDTKCAATIGKVPGRVNNVKISEGCYLMGTIIHELMHTLGFVHEQNRPDRDQFVIVMFDNIIPDARKNFRKYTWNEVTNLGESYDYGSVMHYSNVEFAIDPDRPTMVPLQAGVELGQRDGFSQKDVNKINKLYKCRGFQQTQAKEVVTPAPVEEFKKYFQSNILRLFRSLLRAIQNFKPTKPK